MSETTTITNKKFVADRKIVPTVQEHEFVVATKLAEPEINEREEPTELIVVEDNDGDFTFLAVDSVLRVDKEEKKYVLVEEQKRHVTEPLKNSVIATTMPSTEKEVTTNSITIIKKIKNILVDISFLFISVRWHLNHVHERVFFSLSN
jgi:uncharacterized protein YrzB (UPF0473 family)